MPRHSLRVTFRPTETDRLPDLLTEGVATLLQLRSSGILKTVGDTLRIRRQGGYCGLDVFIFLWLFLSAGAHSAIKSFWEKIRRCSKPVAALMGRKKLASASSISRALDAVELDLLRPVTGQLLTGFEGLESLLAHPATHVTDAHGRPWHIFDFDPKVTALHHRALPQADDLPDPVRLAEQMAAPGYKGRKRGDLVFRQAPLQHAGSGIFIHTHLCQGNGNGVLDMHMALDSLVGFASRFSLPLPLTIARMDGEHGNVPWFSACRQRAIPFITRLNRPALFDDPSVIGALRQATFHRVPDSEAGPKRAAADLGVMTIAAGEQTRTPDGGRYEPITVRVVAVVFPKQGEAKRGRVIDGWQVELFAVDLPADAWPAADAIWAYYARNGFENRLAQLDREMGLSRIVSYHLPGQELATVIGLCMWNYRVLQGFESHRPQPVAPVKSLRQVVVDERLPPHWPRDPVLLEQLSKLDWQTLLLGRPGWSFDASCGEVRCADGRPMSLTCVLKRASAKGLVDLIFRRPVGGCQQCSYRPDCLQSVREEGSKHATFKVAAKVAAPIRRRLAVVRGTEPGETTIERLRAAPGPLEVVGSLFLPAQARRAFREIFEGATLRATVSLPPPRELPRLVASDAAERQRRRKSWQQNLDRYALPDGAQVDLVVAGSSAIRAMLGEDSARASARASQ